MKFVTINLKDRDENNIEGGEGLISAKFFDAHIGPVADGITSTVIAMGGGNYDVFVGISNTYGGDSSTTNSLRVYVEEDQEPLRTFIFRERM